MWEEQAAVGEEKSVNLPINEEEEIEEIQRSITSPPRNWQSTPDGFNIKMSTLTRHEFKNMDQHHFNS